MISQLAKKERLSDLGYDLPTNALDQLAKLPTDERVRRQILDGHFLDLKSLLTRNGIYFDQQKSQPRLKTMERIAAKIDRRGFEQLILDIFGVIFVVKEEDKIRGARILSLNYPTPAKIGGKPTLRNYAIKAERDSFIEKYNSSIDSSYHAIHQNLCFGDNYVSEVRWMNEKQFEQSQTTKLIYLARQQGLYKNWW